jgi:thiol-disulfide isomerase/thioredoxin
VKKSFIAAFAVVIVLAGIAIGLAAGRSAKPHPAAKKQNIASMHAATDDESRTIRFANNPQDVPPFLVTDIDGQPVSTAEWKGKVVLVNFWATWCPPCRAEIPMLVQLKNIYKDRLVIVGVSMDDDDPAEVRKFAKEMRMNYPVVMASREIISEYGGVPALPTTFVVSQDGKVMQKHIGLYPSNVYESEVRALMGLPVDATIETFEDTGQIFLKNASRATELPDVDLTGLSPEQKTSALRRMNTESCSCGCGLTLAQCRINDTACAISKGLAAKVVKEVAGKRPSPQMHDVTPNGLREAPPAANDIPATTPD